jgi:hypothetical protein
MGWSIVLLGHFFLRTFGRVLDLIEGLGFVIANLVLIDSERDVRLIAGRFFAVDRREVKPAPLKTDDGQGSQRQDNEEKELLHMNLK